jgi:hypothetical protein
LLTARYADTRPGRALLDAGLPEGRSQDLSASTSALATLTTALLYAHMVDDMQRAGADELAKALRELGIGG